MIPPSDPWDDAELHRELRSLPHPSAPSSVMEGVLQRIQPRAPLVPSAVWWRMPIPTWPIAAQWVAWMGLLLPAAAAISAPVWGESWMTGLTDPNASPGWVANCINTAQMTHAVMGTFRGVLASIPHAIWMIGFAGAAILYTTALVVAAWIYPKLGTEQV